jgi:hypothetical protein
MESGHLLVKESSDRRSPPNCGRRAWTKLVTEKCHISGTNYPSPISNIFLSPIYATCWWSIPGTNKALVDTKDMTQPFHQLVTDGSAQNIWSLIVFKFLAQVCAPSCNRVVPWGVVQEGDRASAHVTAHQLVRGLGHQKKRTRSLNRTRLGHHFFPLVHK